jgi:Flp pilus assembly protein TadD
MAQPEYQLQSDATAAASVPDAVDVDRLLGHARELERGGQFDEAAELLSPLLEGENRVADLAYRLASIRLKQDRVVDAEQLLRRSLTHRFEDPRTHTNLGVVYDLQGRSAEAIRAFRRAIELAPSEAVAHLNLGALYGELGRYEDAVRCLSRCLSLKPGYDAYFNLALVRFRQGELEQAEDFFSHALRYEGSDALSHFYMGQCRYRRGLTGEAIDSFATALKHEPEFARARYYYGMALNKIGRYGAAVRELKNTARALADDGRVHYQLGIAYDGLSLKSEARESYRRARTLAS